MIAHKQASNHITWIKHVANNELLLFVAIVLLINIDRLALGEYGLLGRIDLSDQYVNKTAFLAKYWLNPTAYAWDASILRGWPTFIGSLTPQHFGSLIGALVPIKLVYPIVLITTGYLVLSGAFLFVKRFLGCQRETALFGSFLFFGITYWYNENLVIVAVPLLPLLVAVTTIGKEKINSAIRFTSMILIATLSFPPYILPLMPIAHVVLVLIYSDREKLATNCIYAFVFWSIFSVLHWPSIWGYWQNWDVSNRPLWLPGNHTELFLENFLSRLTSRFTLFPALLVLVLTTRMTLKYSILLVVIILGILTLGAFSETSYFTQLNQAFPIQKYSFIYVRIHNFIGLIIFLIGVILFEGYFQKVTTHTFSLALKSLAILLVASLVMFFTSAINTTIMFIVCAATIFCVIWFFKIQRFKGWSLSPLILVIVLIPFRLAYTVNEEYFHQGNLFLDPFNYTSSMKAFRVATVMNEPWQHDFFPAQVSIKGLETFGGSSVFYHSNDARLWLNNVSDGGTSWAARTFSEWNNRAELIAEDFEENLDRVVRFMRLNNVLFVRSLQPFSHAELELVDKKLVYRDTLGTVFIGKSPHLQHYYLYRIKNPISRVFSVPVRVGLCCREVAEYGQNQSNDMMHDQELITKDFININLDKYTPGEIKFRNVSSGKHSMLVSINYSSQWQLYVDDELKQENIDAGPLGMIRIIPMVGSHSYRLVYRDGKFNQIAGTMIISMLLFGIFCFYINRQKLLF